jgi:hypothetical protein
MRRRIYLFAGVVLLVTTLPSLLVDATSGPYDSVGTTLLGIGGLLFIAAARRDTVEIGDWTVSWHQLVGAADIALGIGFPLTLLNRVLGPAATPTDYTIFAAGIVGGVVLTFIGVDVIRGSRYVSLGQPENPDA